MKNIILLFILLIPAFLFAQYPATGNKQRLGYQTTGDGLIWRGVAADTVNKPNNRNYPYFQLDTVNAVLYRFIQTKQQWQPITGGADIDSLIYATRYWVSTNFFPLIGGTLTGTGGAGFIGFPSQVSAPGTPASGLNVYAQGSSFNWKGTDGYERQFASTITGGRTYTLPDVSGTFALGTGTTNRVPLWTATNTLGNSNIQDNGTAISILNSKPFQLGQWTTAGRPTGVNGYEGFNTTFNWVEYYSTSGWFSPMQSSLTGGLGTATRLLFNDANGRATDNAQLVFNSSTGVTTMASGSDILSFDNSNSSGFPEIRFFNGGVTEAFLLPGTWTSGRQGLIISANASGSTLTRLNALSLDASNIYGLQNLEIFTSSGVTPYFRMFRQGAVDFRQEISSGGTMKWYDFDASQDYLSFDKTNVRVGVLTATPNYKFDINSTGAMGLPRGTVTQRPTIISSTTPFRYNTDSTALEYGESVGTWRQLATRAYARSLVSGLPTVNIYTGDGNLGDNITRTFGQGANGDFVKYRSDIADKLNKIYLSIPTGNADYDDEARVLYQSGGTKNRKVSHYKAGGIYDGLGNYIARYQTSERNSADNYVLDQIYASMGLGSTANFAGVLVGADSTNLNTISALKMITENAASKRTHWAGLIDNSYGNGGWGSLGSRFISYSPSYKIQTNFFNSNTYFDWLRIDNLDTDTTSNRISFYNNKYTFPNASPGSGDKFLKWSSGTPSFVSASSLGVNTVYTASDSIQGDRYLEMANDGSASFGVGYLPNFSGGFANYGEFGLVVSPDNYGELALFDYKGSVVGRGSKIYTGDGSNGIISFTQSKPKEAAGVLVDRGGLRLYSANSSSTVGYWAVTIDTSKFQITRNYSGIFETYELLPASQTPPTTSGFKTILQWTGDGSNANPSFVEVKRDTTIFVTADTDYDFSAAVTTAQIASRYNRIIIHMTLTSSATADKTTTLHTPDANLMQCEILIRGTDNTGTYDNEIAFGTNNAISSDGTNTSGYTLAQGQGLHVRVVYNGSAYKYIYY